MVKIDLLSTNCKRKKFKEGSSTIRTLYEHVFVHIGHCLSEYISIINFIMTQCITLKYNCAFRQQCHFDYIIVAI